MHVVTGGKVRGAASGAPLGATLAGVEADPATRWPLALAKGLFRLAAACGGGLARRPTAEKVALEIERLGKVAGIRVSALRCVVV